MVVVVKLMLSVGWWNTFAVGAVVPYKSDFYYSQARSDMATIDLNETNIQDTISKDGTVIYRFFGRPGAVRAVVLLPFLRSPLKLIRMLCSAR